MPHFVYILISETTGKYYCGATEDVDARLQKHNSWASLSTRPGVPWRVIRVIACTTRTEALRLEIKIKKRGIGRWLMDQLA